MAKNLQHLQHPHNNFWFIILVRCGVIEWAFHFRILCPDRQQNACTKPRDECACGNFSRCASVRSERYKTNERQHEWASSTLYLFWSMSTWLTERRSIPREELAGRGRRKDSVGRLRQTAPRVERKRASESAREECCTGSAPVQRARRSRRLAVSRWWVEPQVAELARARFSDHFQPKNVCEKRNGNINR